MVISRVIIRVTPFRALITLLTTYLLSPLPLELVAKTVNSEVDCQYHERVRDLAGRF